MKQMMTLLMMMLSIPILQVPPLSGSNLQAAALPGLFPSAHFNEQSVSFLFEEDILVKINAAGDFDPSKPVSLIYYALPNGNSIEQTEGRILHPGDDWHYDIQHIAAQTRFVRKHSPDRNWVLVYLGSRQNAWPAWKAAHPQDYSDRIQSLHNYLFSLFRSYDTELILNGHSGGGRFIFSWLESFDSIPAELKRIVFLDSNYGYESYMAEPLYQWLQQDEEHVLRVFAYNDSVALYNGKPVVSAKGGTWYRSRLMMKDLSTFKALQKSEDSSFIRFRSSDGQIAADLKKNPDRAILHTVQVERNGFIESLLYRLPQADTAYSYYADRVYSDWIQDLSSDIPAPTIAPRSPDMKGAAEILEEIENLILPIREERLLEEIASGNLPDFLRQIRLLQASFQDLNGNSHQLQYLAMPDYLAFGNDSDFCRMPMTPVLAQKLADRFGMTMPTAKLSDHLWSQATFRLSPITYYPVGNENEKVRQFVRHNSEIEAARKDAGFELGEMCGGLKKDVVISNKITDPSRPGHVVIYGWHYLSGSAIQPLTNIHLGSYLDYSHGIRLLSDAVLLDGELTTQRTILKDPVLYRILSSESGPMNQPWYSYSGATGVLPSPALHPSIQIRSMQPNPFNSRIHFSLSLPSAAPARFSIYDLKGHSILNGSLDSRGTESDFVWNGKDSRRRPVASGTYLIAFSQGSAESVRKITLLK